MNNLAPTYFAQIKNYMNDRCIQAFGIITGTRGNREKKYKTQATFCFVYDLCTLINNIPNEIKFLLEYFEYFDYEHTNTFL